MLHSWLRKRLLRWRLPSALKALSGCVLAEGPPVFSAPDFIFPHFSEMSHLYVTFDGKQILLITSAEQKVSKFDLSLVHGMTASKQGGKIFSEMYLGKDYPALQTLNEAETLLKEVRARHARGWRLAKELWSNRVWVDNSDGSHRLSAVAEANARLNLGLSLHDVHLTTYHFNRQIVDTTPKHFRFIVPAKTAASLAAIPSIHWFIQIYDVHADRSPGSPLHNRPVENRLIIGFSGDEFERTLRKKLKTGKCRYLEIQ